MGYSPREKVGIQSMREKKCPKNLECISKKIKVFCVSVTKVFTIRLLSFPFSERLGLVQFSSVQFGLERCSGTF